MTNDILVFAEVREGSFKRINAELVSAASVLVDKLGGVVHIAVLGGAVDGAVEEARSYATGKVYVVKSDVLDSYSTQGFASGLEAVLKECDPAIVLFGATAMGKDLSTRVAARARGSLMTDCTELDVEDGALKAKRPVYSGKAYADVITTKATIKMASLRPNIYPAAQKTGNLADVAEVSLPITLDQIGAMVKEIVVTSAGRKDVTEAEIIVAGGRSLKSEDNFKILEELADVLGASVGASRAAVDAGYAPHSRQVGQTGKVVNPKLYIACGISGAIQHLVGMRTSKVIVAINKDPNAPIFQHANYGIVGDLFEIVPIMTQQFKELLAS
ncbi:MAG: electron transfer flavoprotein subunit alpha/FixB family protein [Candidatus Krumholzibacteria bacterium]|nr:electron transfer flavoprotein subunit alpha/FixB family protein [Candidatus Krumholzibacteria bacterium]